MERWCPSGSKTFLQNPQLPGIKFARLRKSAHALLRFLCVRKEEREEDFQNERKRERTERETKRNSDDYTKIMARRYDNRSLRLFDKKNSHSGRFRTAKSYLQTRGKNKKKSWMCPPRTLKQQNNREGALTALE